MERDGDHSDSDHDSGNDEPNEFFYRGAAAMAVEQRMLGQDQVDPGPDQPHLNPLFMVPNVPKVLYDVMICLPRYYCKFYDFFEIQFFLLL